MGEFIKMALGNLRRNKRRTVLTGIAICCGAFVLTFGGAYGDGIERQLVAATIAGDTGHISITTRTSKKTEQEELMSNVTKWKEQLIADPGQVQEYLRRRRDVQTVCPRVNLNGMLSNGQKLERLFLVAVVPELETDLFQKVVPVDRGKLLQEGDAFPGIYISRTFARSFRVQCGDSLTVMAQTLEGSANTMDVVVKGIFKKGALWRENYAYIRLADARQLAQIGNGVTQFKVILKAERDAKSIAAQIRRHFDSRRRLSVKDWEVAAGLFLGVVMINRIAVYLLSLVLFIVSMAGIVNTMLMAVHERTREIGTMLALGTKRAQITGLFVGEALLLSMAAAGLGVFVASSLAFWLGRAGIPAFNEAMSYMYGSSRTFPYLTLGNVLRSYLLVVGLTTMAALYPAVTAAGMQPVAALKTV